MGVMAIAVAAFLAFKLNHATAELERISEMLEAERESWANFEVRNKETVNSLQANARQIEMLKNRISDLESQNRQLAMPGGTGEFTDRVGSQGKDSDAPAETLPQADQNPHFVHFEIPESGIDVWQNEDGSIQAFNENPELTGTLMTVQAVDETGATRDILIIVPAPED